MELLLLLIGLITSIASQKSIAEERISQLTAVDREVLSAARKRRLTDWLNSRMQGSSYGGRISRDLAHAVKNETSGIHHFNRHLRLWNRNDLRVYQGSLCGNLTQDVRLAVSHSPYEVTCNTTITVGTTLSAGPGTVVKFQSGVKLIVDGSLSAGGTSADPVIITSIKDDSAGGDTNHDGSTTQAAPGDWDGIQVNTPGTATLAYTSVKYAITAVSIDSGKADISYSTVANCSDTGISCMGCQLNLAYNSIKNSSTGVFASNASLWMDTNQVLSNSGDGITLEYPMQGEPTITHNTLSGNLYPIGISMSSSSMTLPIPGFSNNVVTGNQINGLALTGLLMGDSTINPTDGIAYVNLGLSVWYDATLTIKANTIIKSVPKAGFEINGTLLVQGTGSQPVIFSSIKDDSAGGDTNGDGTTTQPGPNDWDGISALTGGMVTIDYSILRYGASPVVIDGGTGTVTHSSLSNSTRGVTVLDGTFTMSGCVVSGNDIGVYSSAMPSLSINQNNISGNNSYGFFNANLLATVQAKNNWWGSADGPKPFGNGDSINFTSHTENGKQKVDQIFVDVTPWLTAAP